MKVKLAALQQVLVGALPYLSKSSKSFDSNKKNKKNGSNDGRNHTHTKPKRYPERQASRQHPSAHLQSVGNKTGLSSLRMVPLAAATEAHRWIKRRTFRVVRLA